MLIRAHTAMYGPGHIKEDMGSWDMRVVNSTWIRAL